MGRRSERLTNKGLISGDDSGAGDVIQVVSRAFDVLRCFGSHEVRLGNLEISNRCGLPRSTVSRLTHTLTRMGHLVYLPRDQKYRIGPSAVAMSTSMMCGLQLRHLIRIRLQETADTIPGTVGFVIPDRFHLVYLEFARAPNALGLHSMTGSRIAIPRTAAGHAYTAAIEPDLANALIRDMEREIPHDAEVLRERLESNRAMLRERGYVTACGLWSPHINGIAMPLWSPQYQTYVAVTIGLLSAMYDEQRMHEEVGPHLLKLGADISKLIQNADIGFYDDGSELTPRPAMAHKKFNGSSNDLEAGTRRAGSPRGARAADGRRRQGEAPA